MMIDDCEGACEVFFPIRKTFFAAFAAMWWVDRALLICFKKTPRQSTGQQAHMQYRSAVSGIASSPKTKSPINYITNHGKILVTGDT